MVYKCPHVITRVTIRNRDIQTLEELIDQLTIDGPTDKDHKVIFQRIRDYPANSITTTTSLEEAIKTASEGLYFKSSNTSDKNRSLLSNLLSCKIALDNGVTCSTHLKERLQLLPKMTSENYRIELIRRMFILEVHSYNKTPSQPLEDCINSGVVDNFLLDLHAEEFGFVDIIANRILDVFYQDVWRLSGRREDAFGGSDCYSKPNPILLLTKTPEAIKIATPILSPILEKTGYTLQQLISYLSLIDCEFTIKTKEDAWRALEKLHDREVCLLSDLEQLF